MPDTDSDPLNAMLWSDWNHDGTNNDADMDEDGWTNTPWAPAHRGPLQLAFHRP